MSSRCHSRLRSSLVFFLCMLACHIAAAQVATEPAEAPATQPTTLVRGPYLQALRPDGLVICLEPSQDTSGRILICDSEGKQVLAKPFDASAGKINRVDIAGLKPGTRCSYEIVLPDRAEPIARATLTTAPPGGKLPVTFLVTGDTRSNPKTFKAICDAMLQTQVPLFIHSGDFVVMGRNLSLWNPGFFQPGHDLLASSAILPAIGNHEFGGSGPDAYEIFANFFVLPDNKPYYGLDYGGVHFIVLDSIREDFEGSDQYKWLVQDLAATKAAWKIAIFHSPWFNAGSHPSDLAMRRLYEPLFVKHGVDMIFAGHDHNYQRTRPILHVFEPKSAKPYWQIVSGGGGAPLYPVARDEPYLDKKISTNHFVKVTAEKDRMLIIALGLDGQEIDRFEVHKDKSAENPIAYEQIDLEDTLRGWLDKHPFAFSPGESAAAMTCTWTNPYPVPVKLRFSAADSEKWQLTTDPAQMEVAPRSNQRTGTTDIRLTLRRLDPSAKPGKSGIGMNVSYEAPQIGSGTVKDIRVQVAMPSEPPAASQPAASQVATTQEIMLK